MSEQQSEAAPSVQGQQAQQKDEVPWWRNHPWLGRHLFEENRDNNLELLAQYEGKHVAWFPDGSGIRDADEDWIALVQRIEAAGDKREWYTYEYVSELAQI